MGPIQRILTGLLCAAGLAPCLAQGIYTCVDGKGRRLTSDRPIIDCIDREQKELNPSGTVRRSVGPSLTAAERAAEEEQARRVAAVQQREADEKRRNRALLTRYPTIERHDKERATALALIDDLIAIANKRSTELATQRKALDNEAEFFATHPAKMPARLKRQLEENSNQQAVQARYVAEQESEKQRINTRFDQELVRLKQLWALQAVPVTSGPSPIKK